MNDITLLTRADKIKGVVDRWELQYYINNRGIWMTSQHMKLQPEGKWEKLKELPENAKREDVEKIIGNKSWTEIDCDICRKDVESALIFTGEDNHTRTICEKCLKKGMKLFK